MLKKKGEDPKERFRKKIFNSVKKKKQKNQVQSLEVLPHSVSLFLVHNINLLNPYWCKSTLAAQMISNVYSYSMENKILW